MRPLLPVWLLVCLLFLPAAAEAQEISHVARSLTAASTLDLPPLPPLLDNEDVLGPSDGFFQDIVFASVFDSAPFPSGFSFCSAGQISDLSYSDGQWIATGVGDAYGEATLSASKGSHGSGWSETRFEAIIDARAPVEAHLDVTLTSELAAASGSFTASLQLCPEGEECTLSLSVTDADPSPVGSQEVRFNERLEVPSPGLYRLRLSARARAGTLIDVPGASTGSDASEGIASWSVILTVPEPSPALLGLVALLVIASLRRAALHGKSQDRRPVSGRFCLPVSRAVPHTSDR